MYIFIHINFVYNISNQTQLYKIILHACINSAPQDLAAHISLKSNTKASKTVRALLDLLVSAGYYRCEGKNVCFVCTLYSTLEWTDIFGIQKSIYSSCLQGVCTGSMLCIGCCKVQTSAILVHVWRLQVNSDIYMCIVCTATMSIYLHIIYINAHCWLAL